MSTPVAVAEVDYDVIYEMQMQFLQIMLDFTDSMRRRQRCFENLVHRDQIGQFPQGFRNQSLGPRPYQHGSNAIPGSGNNLTYTVSRQDLTGNTTGSTPLSANTTSGHPTFYTSSTGISGNTDSFNNTSSYYSSTAPTGSSDLSSETLLQMNTFYNNCGSSTECQSDGTYTISSSLPPVNTNTSSLSQTSGTLGQQNLQSGSTYPTATSRSATPNISQSTAPNRTYTVDPPSSITINSGRSPTQTSGTSGPSTLYETRRVLNVPNSSQTSSGTKTQTLDPTSTVSSSSPYQTSKVFSASGFGQQPLHTTTFSQPNTLASGYPDSLSFPSGSSPCGSKCFSSCSLICPHCMTLVNIKVCGVGGRETISSGGGSSFVPEGEPQQPIVNFCQVSFNRPLEYIPRPTEDDIGVPCKAYTSEVSCTDRKNELKDQKSRENVPKSRGKPKLTSAKNLNMTSLLHDHSGKSSEKGSVRSDCDLKTRLINEYKSIVKSKDMQTEVQEVMSKVDVNNNTNNNSFWKVFNLIRAQN